MRHLWLYHRLRLVSGVLGILGVIVVLMLVIAAPSLVQPPDPYLVENPDVAPEVPREPTVTRCYGVFEPPRIGETREETRNTDAGLNGVNPFNRPEAALVYDNFCERARSQRVTSALLVSIPTVLLLSVAFLSRCRPDEEDYR